MGEIVGLRFGMFTPAYILNDPEVARSMFIAGAKSWRRPPATVVPIRLALGENLFTQSDRDWALLQPVLAPDFRKRALEPRLAEVGALVEDEVAALPFDTDIDFDQAMGRIALMVATWVLFGEHLERSRADELVAHQRVVIDWLAKRIGSSQAMVPFDVGRHGRHMRAHRAAIEAYANEIIESRQRSGSAKDDVLTALLAAKPGGRALTPIELSRQVLGLFGAGNETTAAALCWAIVYGASHHREWAALRQDPALGTNYVAETLRLCPPGWGIPRSPARGVGEVVAGGHRIKVRRYQMIVINVYGMNRDESVWPDAASFNPARHACPSKEQERALLPFGLGPRGCIGQHIALTEMAALLPALARHGDPEVVGQPSGHPTFTLRVRGGLRGRFRRPAADVDPGG